MKYMRMILIALCLLLNKGWADCCFEPGTGYSGYSNQSCCYGPNCCFEFGVEWLYVHPSIDQPFYTNESPSVVDSLLYGERIANQFNWHSGYRVEAIYYFPNCLDHFLARWTHFPRLSHSDSHDTPTQRAILNSIFPFNDVSLSEIRDQFHVYNLELLFGRRVYCCCPLVLNLEAGVILTRIDFEENIHYFQTAGNEVIDTQSRFKGIGPEIAFDFSYGIFSCLDVNGRAIAALLVNERKSRLSQFITTLPPIANNTQNFWYGTPFFDFRFGLNYHPNFSFCGCGCIKLNIEVGYEVMHFIKAVDRIYFVDVINYGSSFIEHMDFTLHGPYVHVGVCF